MPAIFGSWVLPELHNWSLVTGWCAALLLVVTIIYLVVTLLLERRLRWREIVLPGVVGVGIWSLVVAVSFYQRWFYYATHGPVHGFGVYERVIEPGYDADVLRCQVQFAITAALLVIVVVLTVWKCQRVFRGRPN